MGTRWQEDEECKSWKASGIWYGQRTLSLRSKMESPKYVDSGQTAMKVKTLGGQEKEGKEKFGEVFA